MAQAMIEVKVLQDTDRLSFEAALGGYLEQGYQLQGSWVVSEPQLGGLVYVALLINYPPNPVPPKYPGFTEVTPDEFAEATQALPKPPALDFVGFYHGPTEVTGWQPTVLITQKSFEAWQAYCQRFYNEQG